MNEEIMETLNTVPLFSGSDTANLWKTLSEKAKILKYSQGDLIIPELDGKRQLAVMLSGKAQAFSYDDGRSTVLRAFSKGDIFGIIGLFDSSPDEISRIIAKNACKILFIPSDAYAYLLDFDKKIMANYVKFLEKRIRFLSKKIVCFTAGSAERRLAFYFDLLADDEIKGEQKIKLDIPISSLASTLGIGRASLYRAIETLTNDGFIKKDGKDFLLFRRPEMLLKYTK